MMDDDKLIKLVEEHEVIYNRLHPDYKYIEKKDAAFEKIAEKMGIPDSQVIMRRYHNLRDRFVRHKRLKETTGEVRFYVPTMDKMEFLSPHIFSRKKRRKRMISDSDDSNSMDPLQLSASMRGEADVSMETPIPLPPKSPEYTINTRKRMKIKSDIPNPTTQCKTTVNHTNIDQEFNEAINSFHMVCKAREEREKDGALQGFRQMIVSTMSKMSESKQTKAILRVTEAVMQIKMEAED